MQAIAYYKTADEIAGSRAIIAKHMRGFNDFSSSIEDIAYVIVRTSTALLQEEHLDNLLFLTKVNDNFDDSSDELWEQFQKHFNIDFDGDIKSHLIDEDVPLVQHVAKEVATIMPSLTTDLWRSIAKAKKEAAHKAKLEEFLGCNELDTANDELDRAMEVYDDPIDQLVKQKVNKRLRQQQAKHRRYLPHDTDGA